MFARKSASLFVAVILFSIVLSGCVDDHQLLSQVQDYFPGAELYKFDRRVIWIQTQVDGISPKFAEKTLQEFLQQADSTAQHESLGIVHFSDALAHDGVIYLVLGFRSGIVVWDRRAVPGPNGFPVTHDWNLTWDQAPAWFVEHLGYYPQRNQIVVVNQ